jgi:hypothetical protein
MYKPLLIQCASMLCFTAFLEAHAVEDASDCPQGPKAIRVGIRHIEGKGIGYNQGYTTLEGFFAPDPGTLKVMPFLDLRGHVFDNGKMAANAGIGARYLSSSRVWGANGYYDYRNTSRQHYNQVSVGLETLGSLWDLRLNGYLPVGVKNSSFYNSRFDVFEGNYMWLQRTRDFSLKGANAEVGFHVDQCRQAPFYFAAGPYYLTGTGQTTWGGQIRAAVDLFNQYLRLEGNTSYDHFFKWIGQGQIGLNITFGKKSNIVKKKAKSCFQEKTLYTRAVQRVDRSEIIPIGKEHVDALAVDPTTGEPYFFVFVDSTSSSAGTYESPYPTLEEAQNNSLAGQIIYVFSGNGTPYNTSYGVANGMTLQNAQMLLGASTSYVFPTTIGNLTLPAQEAKAPILTNSAASSNVVTLSDNNTVSGFTIDNTHYGLVGNGISNFTAVGNVFENSDASLAGIYLRNVLGQVVIEDSLFNNIQNGQGIYIPIDNGSTLSLFSVEGCSFSDINNTSITGGNGVFVDLIDGSLEEATISKSFFSNIDNSTSKDGGNGVLMNLRGGSLIHFSASECMISNVHDSGAGIALGFVASSSVYNVEIFNNTFTGINGGIGVYAGSASNQVSSQTNLSNNTFSNISNGGVGAYLISNSTPFTSISALNNTFKGVNLEGVGIYALSLGSSSFDLSRNLFTSSSNDSIGWATTVEVDSGTTCLKFTNNTSTISGVADSYLFENGSGVFDTTTGSDASTNQGIFFQSGTIGEPGSCEL